MGSIEDMARDFGLPQSWIDENYAAIKEGVAAIKAGHVTPWKQVEQEIFGDRVGGP